MSDLLFVELGAVVTEVLGPTRCTFEPVCDVQGPTYDPARRIEADFERSLESALGAGAPAQVQYDPFVGPADATGRPLGSAPIGPSWPGGTYEGIVRIRAELVRADPRLAEAAAALPGRPWEYQVVASIDDKTGAVRRYHGFHAEVLRDEGGGVLILRVAHAGGSQEARWSTEEVRYDPSDTEQFYSGALVADRVVGGGEDPRGSGAVFISLTAVGNGLLDLPKQPPSAGL